MRERNGVIFIGIAGIAAGKFLRKHKTERLPTRSGPECQLLLSGVKRFRPFAHYTVS